VHYDEYTYQSQEQQKRDHWDTIADHPKQAWVAMALEPQWEAQFEPNSYGFRPGRSCDDAIEAIQNSIRTANKGKYILDADISKCFDTIESTGGQTGNVGSTQKTNQILA